jgi:hypothetical protein
VCSSCTRNNQESEDDDGQEETYMGDVRLALGAMACLCLGVTTSLARTLDGRAGRCAHDRRSSEERRALRIPPRSPGPEDIRSKRAGPVNALACELESRTRLPRSRRYEGRARDRASPVTQRPSQRRRRASNPPRSLLARDSAIAPRRRRGLIGVLKARQVRMKDKRGSR